MSRFALTARVRLALLFSGLFAVAGFVLVGLTYLLVASNVKATDISTPADSQRFLKTCAGLGANGAPVDPTLKMKCGSLLSHSTAAAAAAQRAEMLQTLAVDALLVLAVLTVAAGFAGWVIAGRILRPVRRITEAARAAGEGDLTARLALGGPRDEIRELADTFDTMLDKLEAAFTAQRRFIANASHELRTPLTVIRTRVDVALAKHGASTADLERMGRDVRAETERAGDLVEALLTLSRTDAASHRQEPVRLADLARRVLERTDAPGIRSSLTGGPGDVIGDPDLLERLIGNLIDNAVRYNVPGGVVEVAIEEDHDRVDLRVRNTGPVIPPEEVARLLEPFTRLNDRTGDGFGLGLSIVAAIARAHDATLHVLAPPFGGLDVVVGFERPGDGAAASDAGEAEAGKSLERV
ncbi:sensor histidine kinase [Leifsonia sp. EB34]|uniref:sensor histidine kinase n=1 Tax=Leifsonia sp. EB34 TaxID=3156303 RepID=UPI0035198E58